MTTDPHDDYYARQQAHRAEVADWAGIWQEVATDISPTLRRVIAVLAILVLAAGTASAGWLHLI